MPIRAMIFDLDGTLLKTEMLKAISYARAAVEFVRRRDDHLQQDMDIIVTMLLAARQRTRVAAQIGKVPAYLVAQCH